jgi:hypothetical protein
MIFSEFTSKTITYIKSVRYLKEYVSFDLYLNTSWVIPKKFVENIEVIKQEKSDRVNFNLYSFVVLNDKQNVNLVEKAIDNIFKYNKEREEKERLFKQKMDELKSVFENKNVDELKRLYFEINENTTLDPKEEIIEDEQQDDPKGDGGHDVMVQERTVEG